MSSQVRGEESLRDYITKRVLQMLPVLFGVIIINFLIINLAPGDPATYIVGQYGAATPELIQSLRESYGLNKPIQERLFIYIFNVIRGDLGYSNFYNAPVTYVILERLPATLLLMASGVISGAILGITLGVVAARRPYSFKDNAITALSLVGWSIPVFWLAQLLIVAFGIYLGMFPVQGMVTSRLQLEGLGYVLDVLWHLFLPALSLGFYRLALLTRLTRGVMLEVLREDYILTARAKGLRPREVYYKHALKNALLPITTIVGYETGFMFAGAALTETVFGWPGIGRLMFDSMLKRDYPVVLGIFTVVTVAVLIANLITDLIYSYIDPRVRYK